MTTKQCMVNVLPNKVCVLLKGIRAQLKARYWQWMHPRITKEQLVEDLGKLGVKKGDIIFVHSSLKSIGFVKGGPETVIDALLEVLGAQGTLVLPCLSLRGSMIETLESGRVFDPRSTPSSVGAIPEHFRKREGVLRSIHPTHSVCAYGKKAEWLTHGHDTCGSTFGRGSPYYKLVELGAKILGLGIDLGPVTFYHVIEDMDSEYPIDPYYYEDYEAKIVGAGGHTTILRLKGHDPEISKTRIDKQNGEWIRKFFTKYLTKKGYLNTSYIGQALAWIIRAKDLFEAQRVLMKHGITIYTTETEYRSARNQSTKKAEDENSV